MQLLQSLGGSSKCLGEKVKSTGTMSLSECPRVLWLTSAKEINISKGRSTDCMANNLKAHYNISCGIQEMGDEVKRFA